MAIAATTIAACGGETTVISTYVSDGSGGTGPGTGGAGRTNTGGATAGGTSSADASSPIATGGAAGAPSLVACNDGSDATNCCPPGVSLGAPCKENPPNCFTPCESDGWRTLLVCFFSGAPGSWGRPPGGSFPCPGTIACNDGTGNTDCCWPSAEPGQVCYGSGSRCSLGCRSGFTSYLYCGSDGVWTAGQGLFPCGADAG